jgi:hypothetical protein
MITLSSVVKINFFSGLIGTLVSMPFIYLVEVLAGPSGAMRSFGFLDIFMILMAPFLAGAVFAISGLVAFPVIRGLQRRGFLEGLL